MEYQLEELLKNINRLPTLNTVAIQVLQLCSNVDTSIPQLVKVISSDQSLTSQVLRIANSSYFNYPREIYSLERAIVILGFNLLRDIAASIAIYSFYKGLKGNNSLNLKELWHHSLKTAFVAKGLAEKYDVDNAELYYITGLLHDIGKLVLHITIEDDFYFLYEKSRQEGLRLDIVERRFLGFHHGEVGGNLMEKWKLPSTIVDMVTYHHYPDEYVGEADVSRMIRFVYLSNLLSHYLHDHMESIEELIQFDVEFPHYFSFTEKEFEELISYIKNVVEEYDGFFEMLQI